MKDKLMKTSSLVYAFPKFINRLSSEMQQEVGFGGKQVGLMLHRAPACCMLHEGKAGREVPCSS